MVTGRSEFLAGVRAELPILLGVVPFGLIFGITALGARIPPIAAFLMSSIVFAGSSQLIGARLIGGSAPGMIVVLTTFVVNLRHMLYSTSVAPYLKPLRPAWKWLLAYLLTDEAYAVTIPHYHGATESPHKHWYFLGAGLALWSTWQASTAAGLVLGRQLPVSWSLDFTVGLTFIGIVFPALRDRAGVAAALAAGGVAVVAAGLPLKLGLIVAALVGIVVGMMVEALYPAPTRRVAELHQHVTPSGEETP